MSRPPVTTRRFAVVMALTIAACTGVALTFGPRYPFAAALFTAGILAASSALLPAPAWSWWLRAAGHVIPRRVRRITVPVAILRTLADLLRMAAWNVPGAAWLRGWRERHRTQRGWNRQLRKLGAHDRDNFCGKGIPRRDWAKFLDELAGLLREMRSSEERES